MAMKQPFRQTTLLLFPKEDGEDSARPQSKPTAPFWDSSAVVTAAAVDNAAPGSAAGPSQSTMSLHGPHRGAQSRLSATCHGKVRRHSGTHGQGTVKCAVFVVPGPHHRRRGLEGPGHLFCPGSWCHVLPCIVVSAAGCSYMRRITSATLLCPGAHAACRSRPA